MHPVTLVPVFLIVRGDSRRCSSHSCREHQSQKSDNKRTEQRSQISKFLQEDVVGQNITSN